MVKSAITAVYGSYLMLFGYLFCGLDLISQPTFKKYLDINPGCSERAVFTLGSGDSLYLFIKGVCTNGSHFSQISLLNDHGTILSSLKLQDYLINEKASIFLDSNLYVVGTPVNNPENIIVFCKAKMNASEFSYDTIDVFPQSNNYINSIGLLKINSDRIVTYGQYRNQDSKVGSYVLWLDKYLNIDTLMEIDTEYHWSRICDAYLDSNGNVSIVVELVNVINNINHYYRKIYIWNDEKDLLFTFTSSVYVGDDYFASVAINIDSNIIYRHVSPEDGLLHSVVVLNMQGEQVWRYVFIPEDPFTSYFVTDIIVNVDGSIYGCGNYKNLNERSLQSGFIFKLTKEGELLWIKKYFDSEDLVDPEKDLNKGIEFSSLRIENSRLIIVGSTTHKMFSDSSSQDQLVMVLNLNGCFDEEECHNNSLERATDFVLKQKEWTEGYYWGGSEWSLRFRFDTFPSELDGIQYYELLRSDKQFGDDWESSYTYWREEEGVVFRKYIGENEELLYDFNLQMNDTFRMGNFVASYDFVVEKIDTITLLNGDLKQRWFLQPLHPENPNNDNTTIWIDEIGNVKGLLGNFIHFYDDAPDSHVLCAHWNENLIYKNPDINTCWLFSTSNYTIYDKKVSIYPNPTSDNAFISGLEDQLIYVEIFDSFGRLVSNLKEEALVLEDMPSGLYVVVIHTPNSIITRRLLKL